MSGAIAPGDPTGPLTGPVIRALRAVPTEGLSRRSLLRRALGAGAALLTLEWVGGTLGFAWSAVAGITPVVRVGTLDDLIAANPGIPILKGYPAYVPTARAFIVMINPALGRWLPGVDPTGEGVALNVRALSQRCPHLGCRPNPCLEDYWFHCPCHQSRYDRLGIKAAGERFGPAARGMDRYAIEVDRDGVLIVDTRSITLGPLPVALGAPGLIPPLVQDACS